MENICLNGRKASFTVEAVFVINITIWVLMAVCYAAVYSHDRTAMFSMAEQYIEQAVEDGKKFTASDMETGLKQYVNEHLFLCRADSISVKKELLSVRVDITFHAEVSVPFIKRLLTGDKGRKISLSHELLFAPEYLWNSREIRDKK